MFRRLFYVVLIATTALFVPHRLRAASPTVPSNTWAPGNSLATARSGATATVLNDGRVLFAGGVDASGNPLASTEIIATDGSVSNGPAMGLARGNHAAILLKNGDVLVTGGVTTSGGAATSSAEMFDPGQNTWTVIASMAQARAGHILSLLSDGNVLVAGGENAGAAVGVLERFDASKLTFSPAGSLLTPRSQAASTVLNDGRVIITGGLDSNSNALASTEIYDPAAGTVSAGPSMLTARYGHTATTSLEGAVVVTGGTNPALAVNGAPAELNSVELFDRSSSTAAFVLSSSHLNTARTGHLAFLLPHNNNILVVGGSAAAAQLASAELYTPWLDQIGSAGSMATARANAAGTPLLSSIGKGTDGQLLVGSGNNSSDGTLSSTDRYGFATVETDQVDYSPGTVVVITGGGWQPGETVTLSFREYPNIDTPGPFTAVADQNGYIQDVEFAPDTNDLGIRFYLTAIGSVSGFQAQHTFTDAAATHTTVSCYLGTTLIQPGQTIPLNTAISCTAETTATDQFGGSITFATSGGGSFSSPGSVTPGAPQYTWSTTANATACTENPNNNPLINTKDLICTTTYKATSAQAQTITATFTGANSGKAGSTSSASLSLNADTTTSVTSSLNPSTYGTSVTFTATVSAVTTGAGTPTGSVTFYDGPSSPSCTGTALATVTLDSNGQAQFSTSALSPGNHTIWACYTPTAPFLGSSGSLVQVVNQVPLTITANDQTVTYGGTMPALTYTVDPNVTLDTAPTCTSSATSSNNVGTYAGAITCSGAAKAGYSISYVSGTLTVIPASITVTAASFTITYGGTVPTLTANITGTGAAAAATDGITGTATTTATGFSPVAGSPYTITAGTSDPNSKLANYTVTLVNGTLTIQKAQAAAIVLVTTYSGPSTTNALDKSGNPYVQYSDTLSLRVTISPILGTTPLDPSPNCPNGAQYCVNVSIGTQVFPITLTSNGTALVGSITQQQVLLGPGTYTVSLGVGDGTNGLSQVDSNYILTSRVQPAAAPSITNNTNFDVTQEDAAVTYSGLTFFSAPSTQTAINIPVSYTLQDATATSQSAIPSIYDPWPGDITETQSVVITLNGNYASSGGMGSYNQTCTAGLATVAGQVGSTGLPSTATTGCTFTGVPLNGTYTLTIAPVSASYYTFEQTTDTSVMITTTNGGTGFITGGGYQKASSLYSNPSGTGAKPFDSVLGTMTAKMNFGFIGKYNKSGSNLQAQVNVIVRTSCMSSKTVTSLGIKNYTPTPGDDGFCAYQIKSNKVISMTDNAYVSTCTSTSCGQPGYGVLVVGATIQDVTQPTPVSLMGGGTLTLQMYDNAEPGIGNDTLTIQVFDNSNNLWFSNSWTGTKTVIYNSTLTKTPGIFAPLIDGGNLQVH